MENLNFISKKVVITISYAIIVLLITSCGSVHHVAKFESDFSPKSNTSVEVGNTLNETGKTYDIDIPKMFQNAMANALEKNNLHWTGNEDSEHIVIESKIIEYEKGNAFKRWLLPGWGSTVLSVQCDLKDNSSGKILGSVEARRTISIGGGYSIGAWETIFNNVAEDVVKEVLPKLGK